MNKLVINTYSNIPAVHAPRLPRTVAAGENNTPECEATSETFG